MVDEIKVGINMRTLLVIPSYNEALNIENVIKDIQENAKGIDYVIVDDGSKDNTREIIEKITLIVFMDL